jgi:hypothetical protein
MLHIKCDANSSSFTHFARAVGVDAGCEATPCGIKRDVSAITKMFDRNDRCEQCAFKMCSTEPQTIRTNANRARLCRGRPSCIE